MGMMFQLGFCKEHIEHAKSLLPGKTWREAVQPGLDPASCVQDDFTAPCYGKAVEWCWYAAKLTTDGISPLKYGEPL